MTLVSSWLMKGRETEAHILYTHAALTITAWMKVTVDVESIFREFAPLRFGPLKSLPEFFWGFSIPRKPQTDADNCNIIVHGDGLGLVAMGS
jgi:hypothetical protein